MNRLRPALVTVALVVCAVCCALASSSLASSVSGVQGTVRAKSCGVLPGSACKTWPLAYAHITADGRMVKADSRGRYRILLPAGRYTVTVHDIVAPVIHARVTVTDGRISTLNLLDDLQR